jgi:hypothetical protein
MRRERLVWLAGGAIAGLAGASGATVLLWVLFFHENAVVLPLALGVMSILAFLVRRSGSMIAARIWSAASWLGLSGIAFWAFATYLGDRLPMAPLSQLQVTAFAIIWASIAGMLAVGLFELGRWLARGAPQSLRKSPVDRVTFPDTEPTRDV